MLASRSCVVLLTATFAALCHAPAARAQSMSIFDVGRTLQLSPDGPSINNTSPGLWNESRSLSRPDGPGGAQRFYGSLTQTTTADAGGITFNLAGTSQWGSGGTAIGVIFSVPIESPFYLVGSMRNDAGTLDPAGAFAQIRLTGPGLDIDLTPAQSGINEPFDLTGTLLPDLNYQLWIVLTTPAPNGNPEPLLSSLSITGSLTVPTAPGTSALTALIPLVARRRRARS